MTVNGTTKDAIIPFLGKRGETTADTDEVIEIQPYRNAAMAFYPSATQNCDGRILKFVDIQYIFGSSVIGLK